MSSEKYILNKLILKYPDKKIISYSDFCKDTFLYNLLAREAREQDTSAREWLISRGFTVEYSKSSVDADCIRKIHTEFKLKQADIVQLINERVTKQWISNIISSDIPTASLDKWTSKPITFEEQEIIERMTTERVFEYRLIDIEVKLFNDRDGNFFIFIENTNQNEIKVYFRNDISDELVALIEKAMLHILSPEEIEIIEECDVVYVMKKRCLNIENKRLSTLFYKSLKFRRMSKIEYSQFLGFDNAISSKVYIDDDFINFFEDNLIDKEVYISSNPKNQWIRRYSSRIGMSLNDFVAFFGYKQAGRDFESEYVIKMDAYKERLKKYLVNDSIDKIYLPADAPEYRNLYSMAIRQGILLDDIIGNLGYERIDKRSYNKTIIPQKSEFYIKEKIEALKREVNSLLSQNNHKEFLYEMSKKTRERNKKLVRDLKEIYQYKCQICSENDFMAPVIQINDDCNYIEVHHIIPLFKEDYLEEQFLDRIENLIVVCPHHHKVLHYLHGGGYEQFILFENELYLANAVGHKLKISTDNHLRDNISHLNI